MPCQQRRHFMYAMPNGAIHHLAGFPGCNSFFENDDDTAEASIWSNKKARTEESDQAFVIRMDVPGVKRDRITIEEKNGEIEITAIRVGADGSLVKLYQEVLFVSPHRSDLSHARATLTNGVLTLTIPKNLAVKEEIEVETAEVPTDLAEDVFRFSLDLPGIAASNLSVAIRDDKVHLQGKRILGDKRMLVHRTYDVPPSMDTSQARALLQDGVFTFLAPVHHKDEASSLRTIIVEDDNAIEPSIAEMKLTDSEEMNQDKEEETTMVETVEKDEWEKVSEAS